MTDHKARSSNERYHIPSNVQPRSRFALMQQGQHERTSRLKSTSKLEQTIKKGRKDALMVPTFVIIPDVVVGPHYKFFVYPRQEPDRRVGKRIPDGLRLC